METRYKDLMTKALARIDELQSQLGVAQRGANEPIAIVGMGCRFPGGGDGPQAFWEALSNGVDGVGEIPPDRWDVAGFFDPASGAKGKMYCRSGSFLADVYGFDPRFFGISPREALMMDPQQRLLLEVAWEALENAGIPPDSLRGSQTGVFVGSMSYDFLQLMTDPSFIDLHSGTGSALSVAAGRLSYLLDFHGPTLTVDTACSSSLVAVHLACRSLRLRECDAALAGGVNVMISPLMGVAECAANMLAPDGRCKTFDAAANGYGRGEGCGMVLLKRLSDAVAAGDRIVAVIRGSAVNHGGQASGLTVPSPLAQAEVMRAALANAGVQPEQVAYVEAHGTGTPLGDPIEIDGLKSVYCRNRSQDDALLVGSVKSNLGHLEGAAGIAALLKTALALEHGEIPPHQNFKQPNPHIDWANLAIRIPVGRNVPWPGGVSRIAGVSSFGFSGTNVHLLVEQAPVQAESAAPAQGPQLLTLSAKSAAALEHLVERYSAFVEEHPELGVADLCFSAATTRSHFEQRFAAPVSSREEVREALQAYADNTAVPGGFRGNAGAKRRGVVFVFPGAGEGAAQSRELYETQPTFRRAFDACAEIAQPLLPRSLTDALDGHDESGAFAVAAHFALQYALAELWKSLGIVPAAVLGETTGEYAAACVAGVFGPEQALALICGQATGAFREPEIPYWSGAAGALVSGEVVDFHYWEKLLSGPACLTDALRASVAAGEEVFLAMTLDAFPSAGDEFGQSLLLPTPRATASANARLLAVLGELYVNGIDPEWREWYRDAGCRRVVLPGYPFQRKSYRPAFAYTRFPGAPDNGAHHPLLGSPVGESALVWRAVVAPADLAWLRDHRIGAQSVFPAVAYVEMATAAFTSLYPERSGTIPEITFERPLLLDADSPCELETTFTEHPDGGYTFVIASRLGQRPWLRNAAGRIAPAGEKPPAVALPDPHDGWHGETAGGDFYASWEARGNDWRGGFQGIERLWRRDREVLARIAVPAQIRASLDRYRAHPALLDACGQLLATFADEQGQAGRFMARRMGDICLYAPLRGERLWSRAWLRESGEGGRSLSGSIEISDETGQVLAQVQDCRFEFIDMADSEAVAAQDSLYAVEWREAASPDIPDPARKDWIILADRQGFTAHFVAALDERGATATVIPPGAEFQYTGSSQPLRVVDLRGLDILEENPVDEAANVAAGIAQTVVALHGVRAARLWLVTRGAWNIAPQQAVVWGLGRTLALEHALLWGGLADLDPQADAADAARQLADALGREWNEDQLLFRDGKCQVARLAGVAPEKVLSEPQALSKDGSYLISGGLGNIGLEIARDMAQRGAGTLVLIGRTPLPERAAWQTIAPESRDGQRIAAIRHIESQGATVVAVALDIADETAFRAWLAAFESAGQPPIRGVVHAAGFADRKPVAELDAAALAAHLAPKMGGALVLDRCLANAPLDFFMMLSSASALLSSPELGAYAAANAFLDALAVARRAQGKPALSIAWGPWKDAGMAAEGFSDEFKAIRALPAVEALALMGRLWNAASGYVAVLPVDWGVWARHYPSAAGVPLLSELIEASGASVAGAGPQGAEAAALLELPLDKREEWLLDWLSARIAGIFGSIAADLSLDEPLSAQGMDSLMALEIRNAIEKGLGLPMPIVELMGGIAIRELAASLAQRAANDTAPGVALVAGAATDSVPLTNGQRALWLIHELAPESAAYHVAFALRFDSPLDLAALRERFRVLVERHAALRSVMTPAGEKVVQRVLPEARFGFEVVDAAGWDEQRLKEGVAAAYDRPFDLANGPLFRVHIFSRGPDDHVMLLVAHHIVCDGWSLWILIEEFGILCQESDAGLAPLPYTFADYARWQENLLNSPEGERLWAFWRERLAGDLPTLNLPTDRPRPLVQTYAGATERFLLPRELAARLNELARHYGATDYMLLLAAYNVLLHRYSGQSEFLVGCPTSGRSSGQLTGVVGHFINPVVLRSDLSGDPSFADFLRATRQVVLDALAHQEYPFPLIVEKLQPERDPSRSPLFQTDFTLQRPQQSKEIIDMMIPDGMDGPGLRWGALEPVPYEIAQQEGQFDISFEAVEGSGSYFCFLKYNTDLFDAATMARMGGHFRALLESILAAPEQKISELPLLTANERDLLLYGFNDTARDYPTDTSISRLFEAQVEQTPDKLAVVFNGTRKTYRELNAQANRIAASLLGCGVKVGDFVGILDMRGDAFLAAMLGILKAGGAYVPIDPDYPDERIRYMVEDSRVAVLISRAEFVGGVLPSPALRHVLLLDGEGAELAAAHPDLSFHGPAELARASEANPPPRSGPRDRAYMIYTSGSTGAPKGAIVRHDGALNHIFAQFEELAFHEESVFLQSAPSSSDISVWQFLAALLIGGRTVIADFATVCSADSLYRLIREERVTLIELVPVVLEELIGQARALPDAQLDALEWAMVTGEAASVALVNRWFGVFPDVPLVNAYGPTEAADDICQYVIREPLPAATHNVPVGKTLGNLTLYVLDERLQLVPVGIPGEICVSGIGVGEGYWQKPDKTAAAFVANPYAADGKGAVLYRTGDQGRWLPDGNLECLGRNDDQVKIRGFRIELGEIEAVLMRHPEVRQALVVARGEGAAKALVAYVLPESGASLSAAVLRGFAGEALPVHMVPPAVVFLEHFPLLPNGKVNRKALPAPDAPASASPAGEAPRSATESRIAALWKEVLQRDNVGIHDNFFELGGHSLLMARLHRRVEAEFGLQFPLVTMFQYPTVNSLAGFLRPGEAAQRLAAPPPSRAARQ
ncbi:MAG: amino acid adenylation domain-containing protein, partial [Sulfuricella sp.]|nr:amino acid adenylation domain-containing protein [Sulfuricella sp.]